MERQPEQWNISHRTLWKRQVVKSLDWNRLQQIYAGGSLVEVMSRASAVNKNLICNPEKKSKNKQWHAARLSARCSLVRQADDCMKFRVDVRLLKCVDTTSPVHSNGLAQCRTLYYRRQYELQQSSMLLRHTRFLCSTSITNKMYV